MCMHGRCYIVAANAARGKQMRLDFSGKCVFVTGGAKGIGGATAEAFRRAGAEVSIADVDPAGADVARRIGGHFWSCDVSREAPVIDAVTSAAKAMGGIDILINSVGIQRYSKVTDTTEEEWDLVMNVNLKSAFLCAKHCIPHMQRRGGGVVVNVSSVQAFVSQENVAPYTTSKTAMLGLTRSIAVDYKPLIRSVAICPGSVDTPMFESAMQLSPDPAAVRRECDLMHLTQRIANPGEIAAWILWLCSEYASFMTGQYVRVDGGLGVTIQGSKRDAQ